MPAQLRAALAEADVTMRRAVRRARWRMAHGRLDPQTGLTWQGPLVANLPIVGDSADLERFLRRSLRRTLGPSIPTEDRAFVLRHVWEGNHYHLLLDLIPQLFIAEELGITRCLAKRSTLDDLRFRNCVLDNPRFAHFCFEAADDAPVRGPLCGGTSGWPTPETARALVTALGPAESSRQSSVFVDRPLSTGRSLANRADVLSLLDHHGVGVVQPDALGFAEQRSLFASADLVIGVHGAGLTNILFSAPGATLIEILPDAMVHPFYFALSHAVGMSYHGVIGRSLTTSSDFRRHPVLVDLEALDAQLRTVLR